ncbi:hypothetical protein BFF78_12200 [Streptomyces fodineus]|uniref:HTH lysR-type domain-containing protein n=1 Tax=Streptomyces fodineus TaxID=1904616 RepID=A0A1D7Y829_9ACTN|nr:LysR family transcriptional regulator [Streptomyces fodineus]AOR31711.1 hypothetical protein BFF78_12200 [Streptomyces fodineus]
MERYEIETFLTLAEDLHFRIGGVLFERSSRRVALTPVGRRLRDDLLPAYVQIQRAFSTATATCEGISGVLRVGFTAPWSGELILRAAVASPPATPVAPSSFRK